MSANYGRTKPVDPLWYRKDRSITATCLCGRRVTIPIGEFTRQHRLNENLLLYQVVDRLRCSACGRRGPSISV